jgi:hypothetical protein
MLHRSESRPSHVDGVLMSASIPILTRCCACFVIGAAIIAAGCASSGSERSVVGVDSGRPRAGGSLNIDPRYAPEALRETFATVCKALRYQALRVEVDQSEFPFIVYGVLEGRCEYEYIRNVLFRTPGYAYAGCFTAIPADGSRTIIAINIIPDEVSGVDRQRLNERLKTLAFSQR